MQTNTVPPVPHYLAEKVYWRDLLFSPAFGMFSPSFRYNHYKTSHLENG